MDYAKWADREIDRIAEPRERTKTVEALAERLAMAKVTLYAYLRGQYKFNTTQVGIMAEFFGVETPAKGKQPNHVPNHAPSHSNHTQPSGNVISLHSSRAAVREWITYPVLGTVEAGSFREADMLAQVEPKEQPGPRLSSHPNATPMAWEAHGDSMNDEGIFDGTILFGVDFQEAGGALANDMIVVVEQNRGGLVERSVKAVAIFPDRTEFQPRSTNPIHKPIIYKNGNRDDNVEVRILTVVHGTYNSLRN